jgi:hypothetical protein
MRRRNPAPELDPASLRAASVRRLLLLELVSGLMVVSCVLDLPPVKKDEEPVSTSSSPSTSEPSGTVGPGPTTGPSGERDAGPGGAGPISTTDASVAGSAGSGGASGSGGSAGTSGSTSTGGGGTSGAGGTPGACKPNERECDGVCIAATDPCCPGGCDVFDNATGRCEADACVLDQCLDGYVDCDGVADNGCEADFNFEPVEGSTLPVPPIDITDPNAWDEIPLRPIATPCALCTETDGRLPHPEPVNAGARDKTDIWAGFAIAWDQTALYLHAQVFDNDIPEPPPMLDARFYDNIEFIFDGVPSTATGADDRLIFVGYDGRGSELDNSDVSNVASFQAKSTDSCYWITARFTVQFLGGGSADIQLVPGPPVFQFDVGVNDYDGETSDPQRPFEHTGHLFFKDPGKDYWYGIRSLPRLELTE